jgi:hypothetical protein
MTGHKFGATEQDNVIIIKKLHTYSIKLVRRCLESFVRYHIDKAAMENPLCIWVRMSVCTNALMDVNVGSCLVGIM